MSRNFLDGKRMIDSQRERAEVTVATSATDAVALAFRVQPGRYARIERFAQAWDAAGDGSITYKLRANNRLIYESSDVQRSTPESNSLEFIPEEIEQGSYIEVLVSNSDASNTYDFAADVLIGLYDHAEGR